MTATYIIRDLCPQCGSRLERVPLSSTSETVVTLVCRSCNRQVWPHGHRPSRRK